MSEEMKCKPEYPDGYQRPERKKDIYVLNDSGGDIEEQLRIQLAVVTEELERIRIAAQKVVDCFDIEETPKKRISLLLNHTEFVATDDYPNQPHYAVWELYQVLKGTK